MKSVSRLALCLAVAACEDATAPLPVTGVPSVLEFSMGGYSATSKSVLLKGDTVLFWRVPWDYTPAVKIDTVRVVPSAEQWRAFWASANGVGVGRWRPAYRADGIMDGVGWGLRMVVDGREIKSWGSNAFPDGSGRSHEGDVTPEFRAFLDAFDQLVGQTLF